MNLEDLAHDILNVENLDEKSLGALNELDQRELAQLVIIVGQLDSKLVSSYQRAKDHHLSRRVIDTLDTTMTFLTDKKLIELLQLNFNNTVRSGLKKLVQKAMERQHLIAEKGPLTYRNVARILVYTIVLSEIFDILDISEDPDGS